MPSKRKNQVRDKPEEGESTPQKKFKEEGRVVNEQKKGDIHSKEKVGLVPLGATHKIPPHEQETSGNWDERTENVL